MREQPPGSRDHARFGEEIVLGDAQRAALRDWLHRLDGYDGKKCASPSPVEIEFEHGALLELYLDCDMVAVQRAGDFSYAAMGEARGPAVAWLRALWPDDPVLDAIRP